MESKDKQDWLDFFEKNKYEGRLDKDGYPTEIALKLIQEWHWTDIKGCFEFIKTIWAYPRYWREEVSEDGTTITYNISTTGWSGNESIIDALQKNEMLWGISWVQSGRGGHYIFEYKDRLRK